MTEEKYIRPDWDEYFMEIARVVGRRGTCDRGRSGCIIARNKQILVTGYVGSPAGLPHCDEIGHQLKIVTHEDGHQSQHCMRTTHAEQNAIVQAAKLGIAIEGATVYAKMTPCAACAGMIINAGIKRVVCDKRYHTGFESEKMFKIAGIELKYFDESIEQYANQGVTKPIMNQKTILGFSGSLASGKGTVCKYLTEKYKINSYRFSTMLRDMLKRVYLENTRENLQRISTVLRENFGQDLLSKVIAEDVKNDPNALVLVEGIRRPEDIAYLQQIPGFHLVHITAVPQIRWQRLVKRNENPGDDRKTYEDFLRDHHAESEIYIEKLGQTAEFTIENSGTFEQLYSQLEEIVKKTYGSAN